MMRRLLPHGTAAFVLAVVVFYYLGSRAAVAVFAAGAIVLFFVKRTERQHLRIALILMAFYVVGASAFYMRCFSYDDAILPEGASVEIAGTAVNVEEEELDDDTVRMRIKLDVSEVNGKKAVQKDRILAEYYYDKDGKLVNMHIIPGDRLMISGEIRLPASRRNPGCFDYALYLESTGIKRIVKASDICICEETGKGTLSGHMYMIREGFCEGLEDAAGRETAAMMRGIMFGETDSMDEDVLEEFRLNGTAHILAVSGLHIGIIYGFISFLWRWKKGCLYLVSVMAFFTCYAAMASFSPSVVRAVIMVGLHILAGISHKRYDLSSAAFFAALVMLIRNPMYLFNTGFQMSFLAVLTMALFIPVIKRVYTGVFLSGAAIQAGLMPYIAYAFNYISLGAVFVNVPIVFLAGIMAPAGLCCAAVMDICGPLFILISKLLSGLCGLLTWLNHMTAVEGITVFTVVSPDIRLVASYYLCLLFFLSEEGRLMIMRRQKKKAILAVLSVLVITAFFGAVNKNDFTDADVVFVDVGQGDCIHIRTEDGGNYLIDGGGSIDYNIGKNILKPYLLKNGVKKLDGIFVTHLHTDHYKGVAELCREGMADRLYVYEGNMMRAREIMEDTGLEKEALIYLYQGQHIELSESCAIDVLWPERRSHRDYLRMIEDEEDENSSSLIFKVVLGDLRILTTADVDEECQRELEKRYGTLLDCDILKVAHHGSKYSYCSEFVQQASPAYAVFQVGRNNFGHPDEGVVENYRGNGIIIYRNDEDGAVAFDVGSDETKVLTVRRSR